MPKAWVQDRKRDYYYRKAKAEKYRSRATYKLSQAIAKYHFIKRDDVVVDLGAAPGGWIQAARKQSWTTYLSPKHCSKFSIFCPEKLTS